MPPHCSTDFTGGGGGSIILFLKHPSSHLLFNLTRGTCNVDEDEDRDMFPSQSSLPSNFFHVNTNN